MMNFKRWAACSTKLIIDFGNLNVHMRIIVSLECFLVCILTNIQPILLIQRGKCAAIL